MAEQYSKPIKTYITENIFETLGTVTTTGQYHVDLKPERLNDENHSFNTPGHLKSIVVPGDESPLEDEAQGTSEFVRPYAIVTWLLPSETDGKSIDEWADQISEDILYALLRDDNGSYRRGGWAITTEADESQPVEIVGPINGGAYLVIVHIDVRYQTARRNGYKRND